MGVTDPKETVNIYEDYSIDDYHPPNYVTIYNFEGYTFVFISKRQIDQLHPLALSVEKFEPLFKISEINYESTA